jgi:acetoacetyl-CoA reductase/3-oxoacyl-[acyl-carrier protein] reductase
MSNKPQKRIALVTGGSRGIGAGIANALLEAGHRVVITYQTQREKAEAVAAPWGEQAMVVPLDIGSAESVTAAFAAIRKAWGDIDILVNNAATGFEKPFLEISEAEWLDVFNVNVFGAVRCMQEAIPGMQDKGFGRIVTLSSVAGQWGGAVRVHYAATKATLINLTQSMARLYSKDGITANAIAPGLVATDFTAAELASPMGQEKVKAIPAGRLGTSEEVGTAVVYLSSDEAGYITGHTLNMNGGMYFG